MSLNDIVKELKKPGLDPRSELEQFEFANIYSLEEVKVGLVLPGQVTNLTRFGAFIDIGVKQDGLVHVSEIANKFISDPAEVLKLGQKVLVKVVEVDIVRKRIALSIKQTQESSGNSVKTTNNRTGAGSSYSNTKTISSKKADEADLSSMNVSDALQALKKKFGK